MVDLYLQTTNIASLKLHMMREKKILIKTYNNSLLKDWVRVTTGSKKIMRQFWDSFSRVDVEE